MIRTTAPNSVGGAFVDKVPGVTVGTTIVAADQNMRQEELANAVELAGLTLSGADDEQLYKAIVALSHGIAEPVFSLTKKTVGNAWPALRVDDADHDIAAANWPDLVAELRAQKLESDGTTDFAIALAAGVATFANAQPENRLLAALAEEVLVHGGYTNWLSLNLGGTDYTITNVNAGARTVTVSGPPGNGNYTAIIYPYRVAGAATTARVRRMNARALLGTQAESTDTVAEHLAGLRRRDRMQGHIHQIYLDGAPVASIADSATNSGANGKIAITNGASYSAISIASPYSDGVNGPPRTGTTTDPRAIAAYCYLWGRRYIP